MKEIKILFFLFGMFYPCIKTHAQVVEKGSSVKEIYFGYDPIIFQKYSNLNSYDLSPIAKYELLNIGFRYEKLIQDKIGIGVNVNQQAIRTAVMFGGYYHFIENEYFDVFGHAALGIGIGSIDPINDKIGYILPYYLGGGVRYFSDTNFGINLNLGYKDGGLIAIGISYKK
jgi:hypothetical protein